MIVLSKTSFFGDDKKQVPANHRQCQGHDDPGNDITILYKKSEPKVFYRDIHFYGSGLIPGLRIYYGAGRVNKTGDACIGASCHPAPGFNSP